MHAIINLFAIVTILGALLKGIAEALRNHHSTLRDERQLASLAWVIADDIDKVVNRGLLRPFEWIKAFGKIVTTNIAVNPHRRFVYAFVSLLIVVTYGALSEYLSYVEGVFFIIMIVTTYTRERTMRSVFHGEVQS